MAQTLRPRGLIQLVEFDFRVYDSAKQPIMPSRLDEETDWIARWMNIANVAVEQRGGEPDAANHLHRWVQESPLLEEAVYHEFWFPTCPWLKGNDPDTLRNNRAGAMMRDDILVRTRLSECSSPSNPAAPQAFLKSGRPLLLSSDIDYDLVDQLEQNAERELCEASTQTYIRVQTVYARRKAH